LEETLSELICNERTIKARDTAKQRGLLKGKISFVEERKDPEVLWKTKTSKGKGREKSTGSLRRNFLTFTDWNEGNAECERRDRKAVSVKTGNGWMGKKGGGGPEKTTA